MSTDFFNPSACASVGAIVHEISYKKIGLDIFQRLKMMTFFDALEESTVKQLEKRIDKEPVEVLAEILINYLRPEIEKSYGAAKSFLIQIEKEIIILIEQNLSRGETVDSFLDSIEYKDAAPSCIVIKVCSKVQIIFDLVSKRSQSADLKIDKEKKVFLKRSISASALVNKRVQDLIAEERERLVEIDKHAFKPYVRK